MSKARGWGRRFAVGVVIALIAALVPMAVGATASAGATFTWGANTSGQLGRAGTGGATAAQVAPALNSIAAIAGGEAHTVAMAATGGLWTWGSNTWGQLGNGSAPLPGSMSATPVAVSLAPGVTARAVAAGANHTLAVGSDGRVYAWGANTTAQLSLDPSTIAFRNTPIVVQGVSGATAVAAGRGFSLALSNGVIYAWGDNSRGQLGTAQASPGDGLAAVGVQPRPVAGITGATAIAAGANHSLAVVGAAGAVLAWGDNSADQLNDPGTSGLFRLDAIDTGVTGATALAAGTAHSVALLGDQTARTWGSNSEGQLGRGALASGVGDPGVTDTVAIAAGGNFTLALRATGSVGSVLTWGANESGQLGRGVGVTTPANTPFAVPGLDTVVAIGAGGTHAAAAAAPRAVLDTDNVTFPGTVEIGLTSSPRTVQLTNRGPGPLQIGTTTFAGGNGEFVFATGGDGCGGRSLASGASCSLTLQFKPVAVGQRTDTLTVANDGYDGPLRIALSGVASTVAGAIEITTGEPIYTVPASPTDIPLTDIPLQPTSPAVKAAQQTGDLPFGPVNGIGDGLPFTPVNGIGDLPFNPVNGIGDGLPFSPVNGISPATRAALAQVPLSSIRLLAPYAWDGPDAADPRFILSSSPALHGQPTQNLTVADVVADSAAAARLSAVPFAYASLRGSRLANIGLIALTLGSTPLSAMHQPGKTAAETFCAPLNDGGYPNCGKALARGASDPTGLTASAIEMQIAGVPFTALPLANLLVGDITPHKDAPYRAVPVSRLDLYGSSVGGVRVGSLANRDAVVSCSPADCDNQNLYEAAASIKSTATIADLGDAIDGLTLGRLITSMVPTAADDFGAVPLDSAGVVFYAAANGVKTFKVPYTVTFRNGQSSSLPSGSNVSVTLPSSFQYAPGTASMKVNGQPVPTGAPTFDGAKVSWPVQAEVAPGAVLTLRFDARPGVRLGTFTVNRLEVRGASTSVVTSTPQAPVTVVDPADRPDASPAKSNNTPSTATPIAVSDESGVGNLAIGFISSSGDRDLYSFSAPAVEPGSLIVAQLEHQTSGDADLALFGAAGMTATPPLRPVDATPVGELLPDATVALAPQGTSAVTDAQADIPTIDGRPLLGISRYSETSDELVTAIAPAGGPAGSTYVLQVTGYAGQAVPTAYSLRVRIIAPGPTPTTAARFANPQPANPNLLPTSSALAGVRNLYLHAPGRMTKAYGPASAAQVTDALTQLVNDTTLRGRFGRSAVLEIDAASVTTPNPVPEALAAFDRNPGDPLLANAVVRAINTLVDSYRQSAALNLASIVIVGGDAILPQARIPDLTLKVNERDFANELARATNGANELSIAAARGYFLSDDGYFSFRPRSLIGGQYLYLPDVAGGRLVETPAEIAGTLTRYRTFGGVANPTTALTTSATDFLDDMATAINEALAGTATTRTARISTAWNKSTYASGFPGNDIVSFNGHTDPARTETRATRSTGEVFSTADLLAGPALDRSGTTIGAMTFSVGCHSGQLLTDGLVAAGGPIEWAQAATRARAASLVGQTGYGMGSSAGIVLTEKLMLDFAAGIGQRSLGRALLEAKQKSAAEAGPMSAFQAKAIMQASYFGIPTLRLPNAVDSDPPLANLPTAVDAATGLPAATIVRQATDATQPGYFPLTRRDTPDGTYWDAAGRTLSVIDRPVQPLLPIDVSSAGQSATDTLVTGLTSTDFAGINPVMPFATPTGAAGPHDEVQVENVAWPASLQYLTSGVAGHDTVNLVPGMFNRSQLIDGKTVGHQRLFTKISAKVLYRPAGTPRPAPATITGARASLINGVVTFVTDVEARVGDPVQQVLVLFKESNNNVWKSVELVPLGAGLTTWSGGAVAVGTETEYFVQAVSKSGRVSVLANKARLLRSQASPPPTGAVTRSISGTPAPAYAGASGSFSTFYTSAAVSLTPPAGHYAFYGVDGGAMKVATGPITFAGDSVASPPAGAVVGDGFHTVSYLGTDGSVGSFVVRIDSRGPVVRAHVPSPNGFYAVNAQVAVAFSCADSASGIKLDGTTPRCTATVDNQPIGQGASLPTATTGVHTFVITATDNAGYTTASSSSYQVGYVFDGFFSPLDNPATETEQTSGSTIPFKWRLSDGNGVPITRLSAFAGLSSYKYTCSTTPPPPGAPGSDTGSASGLRYDGDHYQYDWKTQKGLPPAGYAGTCRRAVVTLDDGTQHTADFRFK